MFYPRKILPQLEKELKTPQIIVLTGMRQVGKTTLLTHLFKKIKSENKTLLDLENPLHRKIFEEENFDNIWSNLKQFGISNKKKAYLFLDEIQNLPQISQAVKYLYDHWSIKFFLTGSSSFYLKNLFPESLAGRKIIYELFPLDFQEFLIFKEMKKDFVSSFIQKAKQKNKISHEQFIKYYQEFMEFGGFPAVVLEEKTTRKRILLEEVFKSYFEKDVKSLAEFKDLSKLRDLIILLVPRLASKIDISKLSSELAVSRETIYNYLAFLEKTYFISLLPRFSRSFDCQAAGRKKLFFSDTGLANLLGKTSLGQLFENSVFQNLRFDSKLCYYSQNSRQEIDFIFNEKIALETKVSVSKRDLYRLRKASESLKLKEVYVVSLNFSKEKEVVLATDL